MKFKFEIEIDVERTSGKFASRDEIEQALRAAVESVEGECDLSGLGADGCSEYDVTSFEISEVAR